MGRFTQVDNYQTFKKAMSQCRGIYQRNIILGHEAISGSTLKGTARGYGYFYKQYRYALLRFRTNLFKRLTIVGIQVSEVKGTHNKRVLVLKSGV